MSDDTGHDLTGPTIRQNPKGTRGFDRKKQTLTIFEDYPFINNHCKCG